MTTLAGEIANRRIGFYWARPVSGLSLWAGKLTGVWLLALTAAILVLLPSLAVDGLRVLPSDLPSVSPVLILPGLFALIAACHATSVAVRSRSALLIVDVVALGVAFLAIRLISLPLLRLRAGDAVLTNQLVARVALAIAALMGGAAAVLIGRTQIRKAHRALSATFWTIVAGGVAIASLHSTWVAKARPASLSRIYYLDPGAARDWVTLTGYARGDTAVFAFDIATGRFARVPNTFEPVSFSPDGHRAVWFEYDSGDPVRVISWNLSRPDSKPAPTHLLLPTFPAVTALSSDGGRLATYDYELLSVYDVETGALLGSARIRGRVWSGHALFVTPERVRLLVLEDGSLDTRLAILEFDVRTRRLTRTGSVTGLRLDPYFFLSPGGSRVIVRDVGATQIGLFDAVTGLRLATLLDGEEPVWIPACFLSGDRVAVITGEGHRIHVLTSGGQIEQDLPLPAPAFGLLGQPVAGKLSLTLRGSGTVGILDLATGKLGELEGLRPVARWKAQSDPPLPDRSFGSLFSTSDGALVKVDPVTLQRRTILAGASGK